MVKTPDIAEKFQDSNTGEMVTRIKIPEQYLKDIEVHINTNAQSANNFLACSRQIVALQKKQLEEYDKAAGSEKDIGKAIIKTREKIGVDSSWVYNIPLKMMERREPPPESQTLPTPTVDPTK